jgi:hypothetical protein
MQHSLTPTRWIIVRATTNSDLDYVDFALISLHAAYVAVLDKRLKASISLQDEDNISSITYDDMPDGYFDGSEREDVQEILEIIKDEEWGYVMLDEDEIEVLEDEARPGYDQEQHRMRIYPAGSHHFKFVAYGDPNNTDEYWTSEIPLVRIVSDFMTIHEVAV